MTESMPAALVQSGTMAAQRVVVGTLGDLAEKVANAAMGSPALLIVGEGIDRRPALSWFEERPLFGRRIVITRPEGEADRSAAVLEALGAEVLVAPTVEIRPVTDTGMLDSVIDRLETFDWIVFTSGNGVGHFVNRLEVVGRDLRAFGNLKIATIGSATAGALAAYRLKADLVPSSYRSEALAEELVPMVAGRRVLLARADRGREILREVLGKVAEVEQVAVYRNIDAEALPETVTRRLDAGTVDWITLTSPAIAERLHGLTSVEGRGRIARGEIKLASLSPVTSAAVRRVGWEPAAEAREYTWAGLVEAILELERA
jgi:uroporphyrinogen III methyltransferase/synthase